MFDVALHYGLVQVVAADLAGRSVQVGSGCWEDPLPGPFAIGAAQFGGEGVWELDVAGSLLLVVLKLVANGSQVAAQWFVQRRRQEGLAIAVAFALAHGQGRAIEV